MARLAELTSAHRLFIKTYRFRSADWRPGAHLSLPLAKIRIALISSAGLHLPSQAPFDLSRKGGDDSFREIPAGVSVQELMISHRSSAFEQSGARQDRNLIFPLDRLRELAERSEIGGLAARHFSLMGSITAPDRLIRETAPEIARLLRADGAEAALLIPT
jgi:D-proline reductase (dithiol) PrdB